MQAGIAFLPKSWCDRIQQKSKLASPHLKQNAALTLLAAAAVLAYYLRRRKKRRQQAAQRHARDLLCDPRIKRSLVPYPSKETSRRLATLTGLSAQQVRHIARSARSGRCARPWHGEAPAQKRRETFARRRHFYFALHKFESQRLLDGVKGTSTTTQARRLRDAARRDGDVGLRRPAAGVSAARARVKT